MLSDLQKENFERDGYLIIPNFFDEQDMVKEASKLLSNADFQNHPSIKFTTADDNHISDRYFLDSGDKISIFLEENATIKTSRERSINKIGHCLHELNPVFKKFSQSQKIAELATDLKYSKASILQSMLIFKQPEIGSAVPGHVDSTFLYTDPPSATGLWFALQDCTLKNGCMYFAPGSHKKYPLFKRFLRDEKCQTKMIYLQDDHSEPADDEYVAAPVSKGSLVLIHGLVYHKSGPNHSPDSRWIYTFHMIDGDLPYPPDNWLQPTSQMPFTMLRRN